ncbi:hypothetical protein [Aureimonas sp. AU12]|uniref:hypothetical protein n=1 Tax=Aureimonas sp. AU12 TaxID=1638161 RepID=UPI000AFABEC2|nr:hypothetical protein [Aureimonas sp. AU12]
MTSQTPSGAVPMRASEWPIPAAVALGSAVRAKGIEREIRRRLPIELRPGLTVTGARAVLSLPEAVGPAFEAAASSVSEILAGLDALPVFPREADDILTILPRERLKWTKDGRLQSAGTRTVKLRGRAKAVTFHVFDPRHIEDVLDRDLPALWRQDDKQAASEARRRAAGKAAVTRGAGTDGAQAKIRKVRAAKTSARDERKPALDAWEAFAADGFLR